MLTELEPRFSRNNLYFGNSLSQWSTWLKASPAMLILRNRRRDSGGREENVRELSSCAWIRPHNCFRDAQGNAREWSVWYVSSFLKWYIFLLWYLLHRVPQNDHWVRCADWKLTSVALWSNNVSVTSHLLTLKGICQLFSQQWADRIIVSVPSPSPPSPPPPLQMARSGTVIALVSLTCY